MEEKDYSNIAEIQNVEHLTKAQRKKLKREQKEREKERVRTERRRKLIIKKIRNYGITILIILAVIGFFYWRSIPPKDAPILKITPSSHNFGYVSQTEGTVSTMIDVENTGKSDLIIKKMVSSCMCTTATIIKDGVEGPVFGMHGGPTKWSVTLKPGEKAQLKINYDPNVHPELRGAVTRVVTIYSNAPKSKQKDVMVYINQVM